MALNEERKLELLKEIKKALEESRDLQEIIGRLSTTQLETLKDHADAEEKVKGALVAVISLREKSASYLDEEVKLSRQYLENVEKILKTEHQTSDLMLLKSEAARTFNANQLAAAKKRLEIDLASRDMETDELAERTEIIKRLQKQHDLSDNLVKVQNEINQDLATTLDFSTKWGRSIEKVGVAFGPTGGIIKGTLTLVAQFKDLYNALGNKLYNQVKKVFFAFDSMTKSFEKATQLNKSYVKGLQSTYEATRQYGVSTEDAQKSTMALLQTVTDFTMVAERERLALQKNTAVMGELGIAHEDLAAGYQASMKYFSQSTRGAIATSRELLATAKELQVIPGELIAQYGKMGPALAKFGQEGIKTFKELSRIQKITGMEMEKILQITNKFDTFEGAAEQVGKINAALGGNFVNAMDLMMDTDPASRFETIRDAIKGTGLSFDEMSYYQKQFFTETLGLSDVGDLALMMSGNMESLGGATQKTAEDYEEMARQAQQQQALQDKWNTMLEAATPLLMDLTETIHGFLDAAAKGEGPLGFFLKHFKAIATTMVVLKAASIAAAAGQAVYNVALMSGLAASQAQAAENSVIMAQNSAIIAQQLTKTAGHTAEAGSLVILTPALVSAGAANTFFGMSARTAGIAAGVLVLALLGIGAALMFGSPSLLVTTMFALGAAVFFLARMSDASVVSIQALAFPMLQLGLAVGIAAAGLGLMAFGFSLLDGSEMLMIAAAIAAIATALYYLIPSLTGIGSVSVAVSPGLAIFAAVIIVIGASIAIAAAGIGYMASSLATMFDSISAEKITLFGAFVASLVGAAPMMWAAAGGLFELGFGMAAFGLGLSFASEDKLRSVADFATGLAGLEVGALEALGAALEKVAEAMEKIPDSKAVALTATMRTAAVAAAAVEALGGVGGAGGRGAGGARGTKRSTERTRPFEVKFILDGEVFERKVIKIYETEDGKYHAEAARNEK